MFSDNNRISLRQMKYMLILEWTAKLCILLPVLLSGRSIGSMIFCIFLGAAAWFWIITLVAGWLKPGRGMFEQLCSTVGKPAALLAYLAGFLYFLVQAAVLGCLCAEITAVYLLPEVSVPLLCLLPVGAGVYLACGSVEIRGRFCEVTGPAVLGLLILLIAAAAFGTEFSPESVLVSGGESTLVSMSDRISRGGFEVFACMGGMFVPLLSGHMKMEKNTACPGTIRKAGLISVAVAGSLCTIAAVSYGRGGMAAINFPTIRVMSNMKVPGAFWQRWDIPFLVLLIVSMTAGIAGALWYMREIMTVFWREALQWSARKKGVQPDDKAGLQKKVYTSWFAAAVLIYFAAAGFLDAFTAVCYYRAMNIQILIPFMFFFYIIVGFRRRIRETGKSGREGTGKTRKLLTGQKNRKRRLPAMMALAVILLAAVFLISGCSARDPEDRLFPMALEIGLQDGQLAVMYAWSEGLGPAKTTAGGGGETESEKAARENDETESETAAGSGETESETAAGGSGGAGSNSALLYKENISNMENLTTLKGKSLEDIQRLEEEFSERYMDYSHVKAIILRDNLQSVPEIRQEVMEWLAKEPSLASGLIVYQSGDTAPGLKEAQEHSSGQVGQYLENLYKNSEKYRKMATTLGAVVADFYK